MLWEDNYLAHFGIKGQKWGVRHYQNPDGTLTEAGKAHYSVDTGGNSKYMKKFEKESNKLKKLSDRADISKQQEEAKKYESRASKAANVGGAALGVALGATYGGPYLSKYFNKKATSLLKDRDSYNQLSEDRYFKQRMINAGVVYGKNGQLGESDALKARVEGDNFKEAAARAEKEAMSATQKGINAEKISRGVAGTAAGLAAASYGVAGYNKVQAAMARKRTTEKGHAKAVAKREAQFNKMMNTFAGTSYADLLKRQNGR